MIEEYIFLIMGLVLLLAGIIFVICWRHLARYSGETTGVIIDITGDVIDTTDYTLDGLHEANHDLQKFYAALCIAEENCV